MWRAVTLACRAGAICRRDRGDKDSRKLAATQSDSVRRHGAPAAPAAGQVRRQSGPPRVRARLSNQETQILMTTINGPTSAAADDLAADE